MLLSDEQIEQIVVSYDCDNPTYCNSFASCRECDTSRGKQVAQAQAKRTRQEMIKEINELLGNDQEIKNQCCKDCGLYKYNEDCEEDHQCIIWEGIVGLRYYLRQQLKDKYKE